MSDRLAGRLEAKPGTGALPAAVVADERPNAPKTAPRTETPEVKKVEPGGVVRQEPRAGAGGEARKDVPPTPAMSPDLLTSVYIVRPSSAAMKAGTLSARVGERSLPAALWYIYPEVEPGATGRSHVAEWIGVSAVWRAAKTPPANSAGTGAMQGFWVAVVQAAVGSGVSIDGRVFPGVSNGSGELPRQTHAANTAFAREVLQSLRRSPLVRWRARLAAGEPMVAEQAADAFADAAVEGLARTIERQWAGVLSRLNRANPELAERFAARLGGVVDTGDGVSIPIWPADVNSGATLDSLLQDMLAAGEDGDRIAMIAAGWLRAQPTGGAVVVDDAAAIDLKSGLTFPSVLLANLSDQPAAAMASRAETAEPDLLRLEPMTAVFASVGAASARVDEGMDSRQREGLEAVRKMGETRTIADVRVGEWKGKRAVVGEMVKIRPPGLEIGLEDKPLMADWTQEAFLEAAMDTSSRSRMPASAAARGFVGRLKPADEKTATQGAGKWTFVFEVARGASGAGEERSEFVLSFGPRGGENAVAVRVLADGALFEVRNGQAMPAGSAVVKKTPDRTFYWVPVPPQAIEGGKVLRVGLVRIDERGRRSAWPRPMLPWQTEPGRIAVDLSSWAPGRE